MRLPPRLCLPVLLALIAAIALAALVVAALPAEAANTATPEADSARVIVKFNALGPLMRAARARGDRGPQQAVTLAGRHGMPLRDGRMIDARSQVVWGDKTLTSAALAARLAKDADVEYAVPDERRHALALPNDPLLPAGASTALAAGQWYLQPADATLVSAINAVGAWAVTTGSASLVVADVDTGVLLTHPDLANKLVPGYDFVSSTTTAGDGGGRDSDATDPGDWTTAGQCGSGQSATNSSWHGTQTASLIGAQTNNGVGMASVGYDVKLLPVRVLGKCGGTDSDIIAGMLWAAGLTSVPTANPNPAKVINLSLGGSGSCSAAYQDAVNQLVAAGVVVVAAAGNEEGLAVGVPANCSGVIAVAGVRHVGTKVGFSSIGPQVALAAPGGNCVNTTGACLYPILTATNGGTTTAGSHTYSSSANYAVGTSFAAPMVSGAAALMLSANPTLTPAQVKSLLQSTARSFPAQPSGSSVPICRAPTSATQDECYCTTSTCGAGMLDVGAAVSAAAGVATPTASIAASASNVTAGTTVSLSAAASTAPSGRTITAWQWSLTSGSGIASFSGATNATTASLKTTGIGSVTVQLTVTDSAGKQASTTATISITAPAAPTASLVASATAVAAGSPVGFDASGSQAASGLAIASYQWSVAPASGSPSNLATFTTATNAATAAVATLGSGSGSFVVTLTVTDSVGQSSSANATITVTALSPTVALGTSATSVTAGGSVSLDSTGSSAPAGRTLTGYQWSLTSGSGIAAFSGSTTGPTATLATSAAGSVTVQLTLTDSAGAQASKTQTVTVAAPVVTASSTAGGSSSGGGGTASWPWLAALAVVAAAIRRRQAPR